MPTAETYRIVPVEGARFMVLGPDDALVLQNQDWGSREVAFAALSEWLTKGGRDVVISYHQEGAGARVEASPKPAPEPRPEPDRLVRISFTVPEGFDRFLERMAAEMGTDRSEVVRKALGLMRIALDAKKEGNRLAILAPEMESDQEIEGI